MRGAQECKEPRLVTWVQCRQLRLALNDRLEAAALLLRAVWVSTQRSSTANGAHPGVPHQIPTRIGKRSRERILPPSDRQMGLTGARKFASMPERMARAHGTSWLGHTQIMVCILLAQSTPRGTWSPAVSKGADRVGGCSLGRGQKARKGDASGSEPEMRYPGGDRV